MHVSETCYIESFTEVKEFLHSIRKVGATNSNEGSYCQSPSLFRAMLRIYERDFTGNEGIMATYHALFIHITKKGRDEMKQVQTKRDWKKLAYDVVEEKMITKEDAIAILEADDTEVLEIMNALTLFAIITLVRK